MPVTCSKSGLYLAQPFSHALCIWLRLIKADTMPCVGNMQLAGAGLGGQELSCPLWSDHGTPCGIACHQEQRTADGGQDLHRRALADDGRRASEQDSLVELSLGDRPLLYCDIGPARVLLAGGLALLQTLRPRLKQPVMALSSLLWRMCRLPGGLEQSPILQHDRLHQFRPLASDHRCHSSSHRMPAQPYRAYAQRSDERRRILRHSSLSVVPARRGAGESMRTRIGHNDIKVALPFPRHLAPTQSIVREAM